MVNKIKEHIYGSHGISLQFVLIEIQVCGSSSISRWCNKPERKLFVFPGRSNLHAKLLRMCMCHVRVMLTEQSVTERLVS